MESDFSGWATKANLKCSDGRTIMPNAFQHQDKLQVPLVWQHGHKDPENVLGHAILENRDDGVYCYGFFNESAKATHTKGLLEHKDINFMSIWANDLIERAGRVLHGAIREVSLVLSGANPGAVIESVTIRHSNGDEDTLDDEAIIHTGLELEHASADDDEKKESGDNDTKTVKDIYDSMTEDQKTVLHFMVGEALEGDPGKDVEHGDLDLELSEDGVTISDVYESMNEEQQEILHFMVGEALDNSDSDKDDDDKDDDVKHDDTGEAGETGDAETNDDTLEHDNTDKEGGTMSNNVFEKDAPKEVALSHADINGIVADASKVGSFKDAVENYALSHGITDIDVLFPDAQSVDAMPEMLARRTEWVDVVFGGARKTPFSRIKTLHADLTEEEARAKGYITGAMKKEEFFTVSKRVTQPTTVYKKQKLDRDDMVDITDFDVVAWLKSEMRLMLDEELARAILIGDGRDISHEDKINEGNIRPIASDHELYTVTVNVNLDDADSSVQEIIDALVLNRRHYRGSGRPTMFTTETYIARFLLLKDTVGRRIYKSLDELANELRVAAIVPVEAMEEAAYEDIVAVLYNPADYVVGATAGGKISMFDDFDIDYNQHKYLIETRLCGAMTRLKGAQVVRKVASSSVLATPEAPAFVASTGVVTIPTVTGVEYYDEEDLGSELTAGAQSAIDAGTSVTIVAVAESGYHFSSSEDDEWTFTRESS